MDHKDEKISNQFSNNWKNHIRYGSKILFYFVILIEMLRIFLFILEGCFFESYFQYHLYNVNGLQKSKFHLDNVIEIIHIGHSTSSVAKKAFFQPDLLRFL
jgi:hypothetical protein